MIGGSPMPKKSATMIYVAFSKIIKVKKKLQL
jgi:hypothetical protein